MSSVFDKNLRLLRDPEKLCDICVKYPGTCGTRITKKCQYWQLLVMVLALLVGIGWVEVAFDPRQGIVCHPLLVDVWKIYSFHVISIENLAAKIHFYEGIIKKNHTFMRE